MKRTHLWIWLNKKSRSTHIRMLGSGNWGHMERCGAGCRKSGQSSASVAGSVLTMLKKKKKIFIGKGRISFSPQIHRPYPDTSDLPVNWDLNIFKMSLFRIANLALGVSMYQYLLVIIFWGASPRLPSVTKCGPREAVACLPFTLVPRFQKF